MISCDIIQSKKLLEDCSVTRVRLERFKSLLALMESNEKYIMQSDSTYLDVTNNRRIFLK